MIADQNEYLFGTCKPALCFCSSKQYVRALYNKQELAIVHLYKVSVYGNKTLLQMKHIVQQRCC